MQTSITQALPGPTQGRMMNGLPGSYAVQPQLSFHNWSSRTWPGACGLQSSLPSPISSATTCEGGGAWDPSCCLGQSGLPASPYSPGVCMPGDLRALQTVHSSGVWWVTVPSLSAKRKNKQLRAGGPSCGTLSKTERGKK